jgi:N-acylneuraminate cytidylyltransferase|tara:strand:- start:312 stop:1007 length:696 start_codon:yes stop_codon:yes gene_type:complete
MFRKKIIAVIPAKGNSRRIPGKNYKKFKGKPIIVSTIEKLKKSRLFDRIIVSTDSKKIAKIAKKYGAEVPFKRPKFLSDDHTPDTSVISHSVKFLVKKGYQFDYVCCVYAPNPFLRVSDLIKGFKKIKSKKINYVFSATAYRFPYFRSFTFSRKKGIKVLFKNNINKRSQDLKTIMCDAGQFYWGSKDAWIQEKELFTRGSDIITIPEWRYHDLDTLSDWKRAELSHQILK